MNFILKLGFRNIFRNRRRTILTVSAIGIVVFATVAFQGYMQGILQKWVDNETKLKSGHIKIAHEKYLKKEKVLPLQFAVKNLEEVKKTILKEPSVVSVHPSIKFGAQLEFNGNTIEALGRAIDPALDANMAKMKNGIVDGTYWQDTDADLNHGIIIGSRMAKELKVKAGDEVSVLARTADFSPYLLVYKVRAVFETGIKDLDKGTFYIHIKDAENLLNMYDSATEILVMLKDVELAPSVAGVIENALKSKNLDKNLSIVPWQEQGGMAEMQDMMGFVVILYMLIFAVLAGLTILNTMLMTVFERTHEIGMMQAMGMKRGRIMYMIITESAVIAFIGGLIGGLAGSAFTYFYGERIGFDFSEAFESMSGWLIDPMIYMDFRWIHLVLGIAFGVIIAVLASLYPSMRAARMKPVEALRNI